MAKVVIATFFSGMAIHMFGLVNVLHNYDSIGVVRGYGSSLVSGRWALYFLGEFALRTWECYNLPFFNGALFLLLIGASAGVIYLVFQFDSWKKGALAGILLAAHPAVTSVLFFKYTAVFYGLAILLAVAAVWCAEKMKYGILLSALCTAVSVGIYQAYLPLTISLFILLLIKHILENNMTVKKFFSRGIYYCACILLGMILYFVILKICLQVYHVALSSYQGISSMGNLSISQIPALLKNAVVSFLKLPVEDYCGLAPTGTLKIGYLLLAVLCIFVVFRNVLAVKKPGNAFMFAIAGILFPVAANFIVIMCPQSDIYTLMVCGFVAILFVPVVLLDRMGRIAKGLTWAVLIVMICNYIYLDNVNYTAMYYTNRQTENYLSTMVAQVRSTEGYDTSKKWAFIGDNIRDPQFRNPWSAAPLYGGNARSYINRYSRNRWIQQFYGYEISFEDAETVSELKKNEQVKSMPCWPDSGSVKVIEDTVVIKLEDTES